MDIYTILIYLGCFLGLFALGFVWVRFVSPKINDKNKLELLFILKVIEYLNANIQWQYSGNLSIIIKYTKEAFEFVEQYSMVGSISEQKVLVKGKTIQILKDNGIEVNSDLSGLVDEIVGFIVSNGVVK